MTPVPVLTATKLAGDDTMPLLIVGPSLGTSVTQLWQAAADQLGDTFHVVGWDLPGHGRSAAAVESFELAELAEAVLAVADAVLDQRDEPNGCFDYAGVSIGGAVGLELLLAHAARIRTASLVCTGAKIGERDSWLERAETVRESGTIALVEASARRWFGPGFVERRPTVAAALLQDLKDTDRVSYAEACEALARFDVRHRLNEIEAPVLAVAGDSDEAAPPDGLRLIAERAANGRLVVLQGVAHLAPAEVPAEIALLVRAHTVRQAGMRVRREVLGDAHVDRASAAATDFTRDFQDFITQYAWGTIWTRPALDRRSRSMITLTALIARGHHEELALHVEAALRNGLTVDEIKEVILQSAIYCGVPDANTAFRIAQRVLDDAATRDS